jgi:hypothetical protein
MTRYIIDTGETVLIADVDPKPMSQGRYGWDVESFTVRSGILEDRQPRNASEKPRYARVLPLSDEAALAKIDSDIAKAEARLEGLYEARADLLRAAAMRGERVRIEG